MKKLIVGTNDLQTVNTNLALEWHPINNGELLPSMVTSGSSKKVWWKGKCGHEWYALISSRSDGHGCPYCKDHKVLTGFNDFTFINVQIINIFYRIY